MTQLDTQLTFLTATFQAIPHQSHQGLVIFSLLALSEPKVDIKIKQPLALIIND